MWGKGLCLFLRRNGRTTTARGLFTRTPISPWPSRVSSNSNQRVSRLLYHVGQVRVASSVRRCRIVQIVIPNLPQKQHTSSTANPGGFAAMSRPSTMPTRNLTLTEELEKLEQSITLTLQEIDHNFSRAHRIVTGNIIPIVQQYAKHSDSVWEGSKFWKQFFEASANVSLSSYEEAAEQDLTVTEDTRATAGDDFASPSSQITASDQQDDELEDSSLVDSPSMTAAHQSTPGTQQSATQQRAGTSHDEEASFAEYSSPYETLREEMGQTPSNPPPAPATPGRSSGQATQTPRNQSSPPIPLSTAQQQKLRQHNNDPLLHRVLDKNYRIGTTPHTQRMKPSSSQGQSATATATKQSHPVSQRNPALDSSPLSPNIAAPELRSEIFGSPAAQAPRTPGISVQKGKKPLRSNYASARKALFPSTSTQQTQQDPTHTGPAHPSTWDDKLWDSDSDTNDAFGMSPPKTMQFHVPQSRLMQTPAKEASKRIVEDLLLTAGAASATSTLDDFDLGDTYDVGAGARGVARGGQLQDDDSPTIVRTARNQDGDDF